jgi:hypothetical protein
MALPLLSSTTKIAVVDGMEKVAEGSEGIRMGIVLLIVLILLLVGALPRWGHSRTWGYAPSGGLSLVLVILLVLVLMGHVPHRF